MGIFDIKYHVSCDEDENRLLCGKTRSVPRAMKIVVTTKLPNHYETQASGVDGKAEVAVLMSAFHFNQHDTVHGIPAFRPPRTYL